MPFIPFLHGLEHSEEHEELTLNILGALNNFSYYLTEYQMDRQLVESKAEAECNFFSS